MAVMINVNGDQVSVGQFYAAMYWGFVVSTSFVGISVVQGYLYFTRNDDQRSMKALVFALLILDPTTTILMADTIYYYFFINFGIVDALAEIPMVWTIESGLTVFVTAIVQVYFASRIYKIVSGSVESLPFGRAASLLVLFFALVAFVTGTVRTAYIGVKVTPSFSRTLFESLVVVEESSALMSDLLASACLCYILRPQRLGPLRRPGTWKTLFMFTINRAILLSMVQIGMLVSYLVAKDYLYWVPFSLFKSKLYTNTFLAMLNSRSRGSLASQSNSQPLWTWPSIALREEVIENSISTSEGAPPRLERRSFTLCDELGQHTEKAGPSKDNIGPKNILSDDPDPS